MTRTRVKICCISSASEAGIALAAGADALGLVGAMPTGPGVIADDTVRHIAGQVPPPVTPFLLTSEETAGGILAHARRCGITTVQIVRHVDPAVHDTLAAEAPWLRRVQVIHVEGDDAPALIGRYADRPHAFLLDSGRPGADELGGTGRRHDWAVSARCVRAAARPVFLAGGLNPDNAADAIRTVRPYGLDICSGVRDAAGLSENLVSAFMDAVRTADGAAA
ncbi:phosphoribosylanthranilate isomerase [Acuticoccus sp. MNP-M23]|uniref:phosphoribosylanthranilate isomerase n=1 Tax=Acuticoccus sp. MNP-M23 TaxID=3072793 RepID=UPI002816406C|nr:phosphoribosylanthranilate isomerase [Acuticoccus sp. MNP-M23]WMS42467.1 phosphoribosylanthranilate isomerase [Acuticoccus sp. MNP-M23]